MMCFQGQCLGGLLLSRVRASISAGQVHDIFVITLWGTGGRSDVGNEGARAAMPVQVELEEKAVPLGVEFEYRDAWVVAQGD
jgi:hypothetical protein